MGSHEAANATLGYQRIAVFDHFRRALLLPGQRAPATLDGWSGLDGGGPSLISRIRTRSRGSSSAM